MLKGKIHRATVTQAELDYVGSITVDIQLLEDAGIFEYEKVQIVDVNNGARFETYTIAGEPDRDGRTLMPSPPMQYRLLRHATSSSAGLRKAAIPAARIWMPPNGNRT